MHTRDLGDPTYEPTDDELSELARRASQDARARAARANTLLAERLREAREAMRPLRDAIAAQRTDAKSAT